MRHAPAVASVNMAGRFKDYFYLITTSFNDSFPFELPFECFLDQVQDCYQPTVFPLFLKRGIAALFGIEVKSV